MSFLLYLCSHIENDNSFGNLLWVRGEFDCCQRREKDGIKGKVR